ncbi:peroxidase-related enzyme [Barrientosiimonas endolithica]|uniref:Alkyl hydroperoxide reductase AhpD n=1 Tax=Barrientosiimonas endolithica TaxID=1535208 RepID=A0ABN6YPR9_9MICO|nr:peroxidase-related enzyme [Barrientosiimonas endolithica]BDZ58066.1 alkyl hydroperoxide reductase AhpD [Barrientosiimonas endolithica]
MSGPARISRFPVPEVADLPEDLRERILAVQEKSGFVPNVFLALAHRPAQLRLFMDYHDELMNADEPLTKAEREMIVVATSAERDCLYCVVAHGAILRIRAKDPLVADYLATSYRQADLTDRQRAMLDYCVLLSVRPEDVDDADHDALRAAGWSDDAVWDMSAITAFFSMSNRLAHAFGIMPNPEFHLMGRVPKG